MFATTAFASPQIVTILSRVRTAETMVTESVFPDELLSPWCVSSLEFSTGKEWMLRVLAGLAVQLAIGISPDCTDLCLSGRSREDR